MKLSTFVVCTVLGGVLGQQALASAPTESLRPIPRASAQAFTATLVQVAAMPAVQVIISLRPKPRPLLVATAASAPTPASAIVRSTARAGTTAAVMRSLRPRVRPRSVEHVTLASAVQTPTAAQPTSGKARKICGNRSIRGYNLSPITGRLAACSVPNPVRVVSVGGIALSQPATMDCKTAKALNRWVKEGVKPAIGRLGGGLSSIRVVADYTCRPRNNQAGATLSEHGKGRAIDIAAFTLENGSTITVLTGWPRRAEGKLLKRIHEAACGPFGTVLGPEADRYHRDHFHLDTARYRNGTYCR